MKARNGLSHSTLFHDVVLISIMAVLAGCGLIYEYLLSHYAGRILGVVESTIYIMIGLMIVSMGLGAFAAKLIKDPFSGFAWLEALIALLGMSSIVVIGAAVSFSAILPEAIAETFNLPPDLKPTGGFLEQLHDLTYFTPYVFGTVIGFLIGMEIPLIARVRESVYGEHLEHNAGTIYGADYIGAGIGAAVWVTIMLSIEISHAAVFTAFANLLSGLLFLYVYWDKVSKALTLLCAHGFILLLGLTVYKQGDDWLANMTNLLFEDEVVFSSSSHYQHFTITERRAEPESILNFFINGRLQFSSEDEHIYHSMLVYPAMMLAPINANVLVIGGGDGLAVRDILKFSPKSVTLIDLDKALVELFSKNKPGVDGVNLQEEINSRFVKLNQAAFADERVKLIHHDAFVAINELLAENRYFDAIIVDLPDPSHPDLDRLYSDHFYRRLNHLLTDNGAMVVQSTSPYHAKKAFLSIAKTIEAGGFNQVSQYHENVPSFGEWGWTIATKADFDIRSRLAVFDVLPVKNRWLTRDLILAAFEFPNNYFESMNEIKVNHLGSHQIYHYHDQAWRGDLGVYRD